MTYQIPRMVELKTQLMFGPEDTRRAQAEKAERLAAEVARGSGVKYSWEYLMWRITGARPATADGRSYAGEQIIPDLRQLAVDLVAGLPATVEHDRLYTPAEAAGLLDVSRDELDAWRTDGLPITWYVFPDRESGPGVRRSDLDRFARRRPDLFTARAALAVMGDDERDRIASRAVQTCADDPDIDRDTLVRRLAREHDRREDVVDALVEQRIAAGDSLPEHADALATARREALARVRAGTEVEILAEEHDRAPSTVRRWLRDARLEEALDDEWEWIHNDEFDAPDAEQAILGRPAPDPRDPDDHFEVRGSDDLPVWLRRIQGWRILEREEEADLFRRYNYVKFRLHGMQEELADDPSARLLDRYEAFRSQARDLQDTLVRCNTRLVISVAKKHTRTPAQMTDMISEGNTVLLRCIEKFDYGRGFKFSTYTTWALVRAFGRAIPKEYKHRSRYVTGIVDDYDPEDDGGTEAIEQDTSRTALRRALLRFIERLDDRERDIMVRRYGLNSDGTPEDLADISERHGVTRERIRQIERGCLKRLREFSDSDVLEAWLTA